MSESEADFVDESTNVTPTSRLKEGLHLKDFINDLTAEFSLQETPTSFEETSETLGGNEKNERRVDTCYEYKDFAPYINLDCIKLDPNDDNPNSSPFDKFNKKMIPVTKDGGVKKMILKQGTGNVVAKDAAVYVHYNSYLEMEEVPFDTSYLRSHKPNRIQLNSGSVYPGFELALTSMKQGEKSQFLVQPSYAFGKMGVPPRIPPGAQILLEIELIKSIDCGGVAEVKTLTTEDKKKFSIIFKAAKSFHALGNDYYSHRNLPAAVENYRKAEALLTGCYMESNEEEMDQKKLLMKIYINLCICYNDEKMRMPEKVCIMAREAMFTSPKDANNNAKLQFNWGKALLTLSDFEKASKHFKRALRIEPDNLAISDQIKILDDKKKKYLAAEKISYKKAFGFNNAEEQNKPIDTSEVEGVSDEFTELIRKQIKEFAGNALSRMQLPPGLTEEEKRTCRNVAMEFGLNFQEQVMTGYSIITIMK